MAGGDFNQNTGSQGVSSSENPLDRVNGFAKSIGDSHFGELVQKINILPVDDQRQQFHIAARIREMQTKENYMPGETGIIYPSFELAIQYSQKPSDVYSVDVESNAEIQRRSRLSLFFSAKYKKDDFLQELNYTGIETTQMRYDKAQPSRADFLSTSHEFMSNKIDRNDEALVRSLYAFVQDIAPERASEVKQIIHRQYQGQIDVDGEPDESGVQPVEITDNLSGESFQI